MTTSGYTESEMRVLRADVASGLQASGLPPDCLSVLRPATSICRWHSEVVKANLYLPNGIAVRIRHCGCKFFIGPRSEGECALGLAEHLVREIVWYWRRFEETMVEAARARGYVEAEILRAAGRGMDYRLVKAAPGNFDTFRNRTLWTEVTVEILGQALLPEPRGIPIQTPFDAASFFRRVRESQRDRKTRLDELASVGARGEIDKVALAAIRRFGFDPAAVVAFTEWNCQTSVLDLRGTELRLRWDTGTLRSSVELAPGVCWDFGEIEFSADVPLPRRMGFVGRPIADFVQSPLLRADAVVKCESFDRPRKFDGVRTILSVEPEVELFAVRPKWRILSKE